MLRFFVIGAIVLVVGWFGASYFMSKQTGVEIQAIGGRWSVEDVEWTKTEQHWRLSAFLVPTRVSLRSVKLDRILTSLCGSILTSLSRLHDERIGREDLYRLDLNFAVADDKSPAFPSKLPVAILDGSCKVGEFGDVYLPTYAGDLSGWYLAGSGIQTGSEGVGVRSLVFRNRPGRDDGAATFPFDLACRFVRDDPTARGVVTARDGELSVERIADDQEFTIVAQEHRFGSVINVGRFISKLFVITENGCKESAV